MSFDLEELTIALSLHGRVARVVVAAVQGSTPRDVGASMLVWKNGQSGTIGGGALEYEAAKRALNGKSVETIPLGPSLGQCCGGRVTIVTEVFETAPSIDRLYTRRIKDLQSPPLSLKRQQAAIRRGEPVELLYQNGWLSEPVKQAKTPLWIFGAGHVGRALVNVISPLSEFAITWIDTAPDRFPTSIPDPVTQLCAAKPSLAVSHAPINASHLVLTYSHALDLDLCHHILTHGFNDAGLIGSKTKWARFQARLADLGHSKEQISRITCPIGDPSLGKHPQEIAVGVATSLLSRRTLVSLGKDCAI